MSEKRFTTKNIICSNYCVWDNNDKPYGNDEVVDLLNEQDEENEQLKQEIKQYWKCRDKWKQEAKELKKEADYFERKKCEYWNMYNEAHSDRIILKKENEELRQKLDFYLLDEFEWKEKYGD